MGRLPLWPESLWHSLQADYWLDIHVRCLCCWGQYLCFWSLMPFTQVGESEFFHKATGGSSSCGEMLMGRSVCCHSFNKLHAADWMTFVNLSGLFTWENLSKPNTLVKIPLATNDYRVKSRPTRLSKLSGNTWFVSPHNKWPLKNIPIFLDKVDEWQQFQIFT